MLDRRLFVRQLSSTLAATALGACHHQRITAPSLGGNPFTLGIASGDARHDRAVLWTRLAPDPLGGGGMPSQPVAVSWMVAEDEQFQRTVREGVTVARPESAHSVHVDVEGLEPDRWYWYRFGTGAEVSPTGRTRTLPAPGTPADRVRFAVASCQHWERGLYTAYAHMAEEDLDFVVHLGDYIYELAAREGRVRQHLGGELMTLDDYRLRFAQYKTDPLLQLVHQRFPWYVTWDDHEVDNNYAAAISENDDPPGAFLARRAAAYQAYFEHMPLRAAAQPTGSDATVYQAVPYGTLATLYVLDTRQYRTDQPCGDGAKPQCPEAFDPQATMLGFEQEAWLERQFAASTSTWNALAQQVIMASMKVPRDGAVRYFLDTWSGYPAARDRLLAGMRRTGVSNPVVLTGDAHAYWVFDLTEDPEDPNAPIVASEFVGTSISSGGNGAAVTDTGNLVLANNAFAKFHSFLRGYLRCDVTPRAWRSDLRVLDYVTEPGAPIATATSFVIEDGRPGVQPA